MRVAHQLLLFPERCVEGGVGIDVEWGRGSTLQGTWVISSHAAAPSLGRSALFRPQCKRVCLQHDDKQAPTHNCCNGSASCGAASALVALHGAAVSSHSIAATLLAAAGADASALAAAATADAGASIDIDVRQPRTPWVWRWRCACRRGGSCWVGWGVLVLVWCWWWWAAAGLMLCVQK